MAANSVIELVNLDFDAGKTSFINYLQTQPRFKGYNFAGDDFNILLDILQINTFRNAFLFNMAISEGYNDSAQLFDNVKSHAKELNYCPRSVTSASANVTVSFSASGASQPYIIPKGSTFSSQIKNHNFSFSIAEPLIVASADTSFSFTTKIYEGIYVKDSYVFNAAASPPQHFQLSNANADTSSLVVNVFGNNSIGVNYNLATSLLDLDSNSAVYFLQTAAANGNFEVLFGDGIFGSQPLNGSVIILDYRIPSGNLCNGASNFGINFDPTGTNEVTSSVTIVTNEVASGGSAAETIEQTRFRAPRWFQVQERCIVPSDYEIVLTDAFPEITDATAYGGESLYPPQFGKVVIALYLAGITGGIPQSKVTEYTNYIKGRNPLSIQPIFIGPEFSYIQVNTEIFYNVNVSLESDATIYSIVANAINNWNTQNLNKFKATFWQSSFNEMFDELDASIVSFNTLTKVYKKIYPSQVSSGFYLNYNIPLVANISQLPTTHPNNSSKTLTSSNFYYKGNLSQLEDDGAGTVRIVNLTGTNLTSAGNVGTIDYTNGIVTIADFSVDSFSGVSLNVYVQPESVNISANQNTVLLIEPTQTIITINQLSLPAGSDQVSA